VQALSELIAPPSGDRRNSRSARRLALVGLAKNTGKTQTLTTILAEHARSGVPIGVTSIGRDGEAHDVIDARIDKPAIRLPKGGLVASTDALLRASGLAHERLQPTGMRTPLGEVVIARLSEPGAVEVAGPSAAEDVREVSDAMLDLGAAQVLIDGSIDRRAASSPAVADGLVMATGAVLGEDVEQVLAATIDAVELVRLPVTGLAGAANTASGAGASDSGAMADSGNHGGESDTNDAADSDAAPVTIPGQVALSAESVQIAALLREHPRARTFIVEGALGEGLLRGLIGARREWAGRELRIVAHDPTRVFLAEHGPGWHARQGVRIEVMQTIDLRAITVNPVAPQSHRLDSERLREAIVTAIPDVPVLDVLDPDYPVSP
jgi:hypothetical protein